MEIRNLKININWKFDKLREIVRRSSNWILFIIFFAFVGYYAFLWYRYVYNSEWSESKKQEYISTKEKEVVFKKDQFDLVVKQIKNRKVNYINKSENVPDIFKLE